MGSKHEVVRTIWRFGGLGSLPQRLIKIHHNLKHALSRYRLLPKHDKVIRSWLNYASSKVTGSEGATRMNPFLRAGDL
jgi:hypothetical protein